MKLCRFVLIDSPEVVRTGIYADRVYETHGLQGVGIHEPSKVRILTPTGQLTSVRFWEAGDCTFLNPTGMMGPLAEFDFPANTKQLDVEFCPAAILKDIGERLAPSEVPALVLGYTILICFVARDLLEATPGRGRSYPIAIGPFITTPEDLDELAAGAPADLDFNWKGSLAVNGELIQEVAEHRSGGFAAMLALSSEGNPITPSDLIAGGSVPMIKLDESPLQRFLQPGDTVQATLDPLGTLVVRIV